MMTEMHTGVGIALVAATVFFAASRPARGMTYYSKQGGVATTLTDWNSDPGGAGSAPSSFSTGDTFVIQGGHKVSTVTIWWTVSGGGTIRIDNGGTLSLSAMTLSIGGNLINNGVLTNGTSGVATVRFTSVGSYAGTGINAAGSFGTSRINWLVNAGATLTLDSNLAYLNTGSSRRNFTVNGTLDCRTNILTGGIGIDFILGTGATLVTANPGGINASLQSFASINLTNVANYIFNGSIPQSTGALLPRAISNLTLANAGGVELYLNGTTLPLTAATVLNNGPATINVAGGTFAAGRSYPLVKYSNLGGTGRFALASLPSGMTATLSTNGDSINMNVINAAHPELARLVPANGGLQLEFKPLQGYYSYEVLSSSDLASWIPAVSLRGQAIIQWDLPPSEVSRTKRFYKVNKVVAEGLSNLVGWSAFQSSTKPRFQVGLIGDSFTHNRARYALRLKKTLTGIYGDLGAGFLGFASFSATGLNGSIDDSQLSYNIDYPQWSTRNGGGYGPDAGHVTSVSNNASISIQVLKAVDRLKLYYATSPGTAGFQYQIRSVGTNQEWRFVATDAALSLGVTTIDVSSYAAPYTILVQTLGTGVSLIGAEAIQDGTGVVVNKLGASGCTASQFVANAVAKSALDELRLDMAIIMFGTNEQAQDQTPGIFSAALQNIIANLRAGNPNIDVVFMLPCYTKFELETPKQYKLQDYGEVMREAAAVNHAAFIDFSQVFGPAVLLQDLIDMGLMHSDRVHPSATGVGSGGYLMADTITWSVLSLDRP